MPSYVCPKPGTPAAVCSSGYIVRAPSCILYVRAHMFVHVQVSLFLLLSPSPAVCVCRDMHVCVCVEAIGQL